MDWSDRTVSLHCDGTEYVIQAVRVNEQQNRIAKLHVCTVKQFENVFSFYLWFGLSVYLTWYGIVSLIESGDLLAPSFAPGLVNQGGGAVRGALPCYPAQ